MILPLITAALTTFNLLYSDQPIAERRAAALVGWRILKLLIWSILSSDEQKQITALEAAAPPVAQ